MAASAASATTMMIARLLGPTFQALRRGLSDGHGGGVSVPDDSAAEMEQEVMDYFIESNVAHGIAWVRA